jgi:hypothetical protein
MKSAILFLLLCIPALGQTYVNSAHANGSGTSQLISYTPAGAHCFLMVAVQVALAGPTLGVSDDRGQTWTVANPLASNAAGFAHETWFTPDCLSGATNITGTASSSGGFIDVKVIEISGLSLTSPLDQVSVSSGSSTLVSSGATPTTSVANEIAIGFCNKLSGTLTQDPAYDGTAILFGGLLQYKVLTSTGAQTSTCALSPTGSWTGTVATFSIPSAPSVTKRPIAY